MGGEWVEKTIGEIADVVGGSTPSTHDLGNFDGDVPWLTPKDLAKPRPRYVTRGYRNLSRKGLQSCSAQLLPANSVLVSSRAPIGYLAIAANPIATNQGFRSLVMKPGYDHEFIYYWLLDNVGALERHATGTTFKELTGRAFKQIRVRLPSEVSEQRAIAHILGTLDDKIELNRRMSATLEAMARAIFQDWFVDFGPTRAKMEGRPHYLAPDLWSLFPDRLDAEGKPEGWQVSTIGQEVAVVGGTTPSTKEPTYWNGDLHWATPKDLSTLSVPVLTDTERRITPAGLAQIGSGLLPVGSVLLSSRAPIGYLAVNLVPTAINQGFIGMMCDGRLPNIFVWLWTAANMDAIKQKANGSTFQEISKANFRPLRVIVPSARVLAAFDCVVRPLWERLCANVKEQATLAATRDLLLPRLMSGELRVRDAERLLERVT